MRLLLGYFVAILAPLREREREREREKERENIVSKWGRSSPARKNLNFRGADDAASYLPRLPLLLLSTETPYWLISLLSDFLRGASYHALQSSAAISPLRITISWPNRIAKIT